jgi:uridine kinase
MIEHDLLVNQLRVIIKDNLYVEDNELYIRCKMKYDLYSLMRGIDKKYMKELLKELEYNERD